MNRSITLRAIIAAGLITILSTTSALAVNPTVRPPNGAQMTKSGLLTW